MGDGRSERWGGAAHPTRSQPTLEQKVCSRPTPRDVPLAKRHLQPLRNRLDKEKPHLVLDLLWDVEIDVFPVRPREYHLLHTRSVGSQDFLFDPTDGLDATAECDLDRERILGICRCAKVVLKGCIPLRSWRCQQAHISP